jgi:hypothetical protein
VTTAVTDGRLPFRDTLYAAYVCVRILPDDGRDSQPKHVVVYKLIVQLLITKTYIVYSSMNLKNSEVVLPNLRCRGITQPQRLTSRSRPLGQNSDTGPPNYEEAVVLIRTRNLSFCLGL